MFFRFAGLRRSVVRSFSRHSLAGAAGRRWRGGFGGGALVVLAAALSWLAGTGVAGAQTYSESILVNFTGNTGAAPGDGPFYGNLVQASDGNFYGTTVYGGANGYGAVFKVTPSGTYTLLHSFSTATTDGEFPDASLVQGTDGNLYGTTNEGGATGYGTVFKITPSGTFTLLHSFSTATTDGANPLSTLVQGTDGNFYGTTLSGGASNVGTVFKITASGSFSLVHSFSIATTDGEIPRSGLLQGTDGNFYGTTYYGGANDYGTVYKITSGGTVTLLHSFSSATTDGALPYAGLVQGTDGNFYGTTYNGGATGYGTVFKITASGSFILLHSFAYTTADGYLPESAMLQGTDGNFYGTTFQGGASRVGAVFQITPSGTVTLVHSFLNSTTDGDDPYSGLVQGTDGNFYGTTENGGNGSGEGGIVFKISPSPALTPPVVLNAPASVTAGGSFTLGYAVSNATSATLQQCFATNTAGDTTGWTGVKTAATTNTNASLTASSTPGTYVYTLTCGGMESSQISVQVTAATPTVSVSAVNTPYTSTSDVFVVASESGSAGAVTGGVVTFSVIAPATGSFSPTTCTLPAGGTCYTEYIPTGTLAIGTYTNDIQASFTANNAYAAATANNTLTVGAAAPTVSVSPVTSILGSTSAVTVTATESGTAGAVTGGVVSFTLVSPATGSFSPTSCTLPAGGSCSVSYLPTGTASLGTYSGIGVGFSAIGNYPAQNVTANLSISDVVSLLTSFTGKTGAVIGANPQYENLIQASDGNFYGATTVGGANGFGAVFKVTPAGIYTLLHSFASTDGNYPYYGLVQGTDGSFYGVTANGGANSEGTVFKITSGGTFTLLHSFLNSTAEGNEPFGSLVQGTDGNFYGTTGSGGSNGVGTVFKISPVSPYTVTTLHSFTSATDGSEPSGNLVQGTDGSFYGTGQLGGANGDGTVFKISPVSPYTLTVLHSFSSATTDGNQPVGGLIQGTDGNFYGTTLSGGANSGGGTVFKISPVSPYTLTLLHSFGTDAAGPLNSLVEGTDGNFYGTTDAGGASTLGTVFEVSSSGAFTLLHSFSNATSDGKNAQTGLVQGADGSFYGMTYAGGTNNDGAIYKLVPSPAQAGPIALSVPSSVPAGSSFSLSYSVANAGSATLQQCFATNTAGDTTGWTGIKTAATTNTNASLTAPSTAGTYIYTLTCGGMESNQISVQVTAATPTAAVSAVNTTYGSTTGVTVTVTESGSSGVVTGGIVTFSVIAPATGTFSPASCTLSAVGTCTTTYTPSGTLAIGTYTNDIQASFAANNAYASAIATSTLTIAAVAPTVAVSSVTVPPGSTTSVTVTATESGSYGLVTGGVVTFSVISPATGSFSPASCTLPAGGSCSVSYIPTGTLAISPYTNDLSASFSAVGNYAAASATSTLTVDPESVLVNFSGTAGAAPGANPLLPNLIQASDGNFYGTTFSGGANYEGTVFKMTPSGAITVLHTFSSAATDGYTPASGLVQGTDGNFYGTTLYGGAGSNYGTVFKMTSSGTFSLLHSFSAATTDGANSVSGLVQGTDGNLYGTTYAGGANNDGTVFKITPSGTFTLLHSFTGTTSDGYRPESGLVQGTDGNFYGTTLGGGANNDGTVFKITPSGTFTLLHSFTSATTDGSSPQGDLVQGTDGNFYGTTSAGGTAGYGSVFKITPSGIFTLLHSFSTATTDGETAYTALVLGTDGNFYGTTSSGGANVAGTVFKITSSGSFNLLHSFSGVTTDGNTPESGLVQGMDGNFYGVTYNGGANGDGTIYKITSFPSQAAPVALSVPSSVLPNASFTLTYSVANAYSDTLQQCFAINTGGDTTGWTGIKTGSPTATNASLTAPSTAGTYTYTLTCGGMESSLVTLNVVAGTAVPTTASVSAVSVPYGSTTGVMVTATESGSSGVVTGGVVSFSVIAPATGSFSPTTCTLSAAGTCTTTYTPTGSLAVGTYVNDIQASFAATNAYAAANGTSTLTIAATAPTVAVSSVTVPAGSTISTTVTATESGSAGAVTGGVVMFSVVSPATGSFSPTTCTLAVGGSCSVSYIPTGTLAIGIYTNDISASFSAVGNYAVANATSTLVIDPESVVVNFTGTTGAAPGALSQFGNLIQANDGNYYGTTESGGANGYGTVFKMTPSGTITLLHSFSTATTDGYHPMAGVVEGTDGSFYGTTYGGGANGYGTVFKVTPSGTFTQLHSFANVADGEYPQSSLVQGTDGNFYGTTRNGASAGSWGGAFKITSSGTFTLLHSFSNATTDGYFPDAGLVQGTDGNFYGTTVGGGATGYGTVFKMTSSGTLTLVHSFSSATTDGNAPYGGLVQGTDGNYYGTTNSGGANSRGTVFKVTPSGTFTLLHSFSSATSDGTYPQSSLVQGTDSNFYGTTTIGGVGSNGTVFEITPSGTFTLLHSFINSTTDGYDSESTLLQGTDGNYYGTTLYGGANSDGVVFKITSSPAQAAPVVLSVPSSVQPGASFTLTYSVANAYSATLQQCFATNTGGDTTGWTGIKTGSPTATNASLTAPAAAGSYTYALTCGGIESNLVTLNVVAGTVVPTTASVSAVSATVGSTTGVTVTATESGASGVVTGGIVTFSVISPATGSFSPTTCTLSSAGTCTTTYIPTGTLVGGTYTNDIQASFAANNAYAAAIGTSTLTIVAYTPTVSVTSPIVPYQSTTAVTVTATENGSYGSAVGSVVTFGVTSPATGSFSPATCTISTIATCTTTYVPTGSLAIGNYTNDITASFTAAGNYAAASATSTLTIDPETVLLSFTGTSGAAPGANPEEGNLIQASDGNFYGTAQNGGASGDGTVFKISPSGVFTLLHTFTGTTTDGKYPGGGLVQGTDGNFYGMTADGGVAGQGTVFKMTPSGTFTVLHSFSNNVDGEYPQYGLVQGSDGNFYGVTYLGGVNGNSSYGTVFKITSSGVFTLLHSFSGGTTDGRQPSGSLVQGADGNFYGTTSHGGAANVGIVFQITSGGVFTLLRSFSTAATDGEYPSGGLVQGTDGNFYGTTANGGANGNGTAYKLTPSGSFTLLHSFYEATDGLQPQGLLQGTDGNFYGTASQGGVSFGTAYKITPSGTFTLLHSFLNDGTDGWEPTAGLVQGMDGNFYGTTFYGLLGTTNSYGVVYKITSYPALAGPVALSLPSSVAAGASFTLTYSVANAYSATLQQCFATNTGGDTTGWTGIKAGSSTATNASLTAPSAAGNYTYSLTCGGMESSLVSLVVNAPVAPTTATVSAVSAPGGSTAGVTVTATESGSAGVVTGGVVTFSVLGSATGSFSPTTCTLNSAGSCTTTYIPTGTLAGGTYTNDIQASFAANNAYAATSATNTLTITQTTPTITWTPTSTTGYQGAAIGSGVLDAQSTVAGSFSYTATNSASATTSITAATKLTVGVYTLSATFTPTNTGVYTTASSTIQYTVIVESVFVSNSPGSVVSLYGDGSLQTGATSGGGIGAAVDSTGAVWSIDTNGSGVTKFTDAGALSADYTGIGLSGATALAIDGSGVIWITNGNGTVVPISSAGAAVSTTPYAAAAAIGTPASVSVSQAGSLWIADSAKNTVVEVIGVATPVVTPTVTGVINSSPAKKP